MALTARAKADAGLWLLEEAILEVIRQKGPMQPTEVSDALDWPKEGGKVTHGIMEVMESNNLLSRTDKLRSKYAIVS